MELLLRVIVQRVHAIGICGKDDDMNFQRQYLVLIVVVIDVCVADALIAEALFRQAELTFNIRVRGGKEIMDRIIVNRPSEHIKYLCTQLKLQYLSGKDVIHTLLLQKGKCSWIFSTISEMTVSFASMSIRVCVRKRASAYMDLR